MAYLAEYIWIDGAKPTPSLRSKTKVVADGGDLPVWGFDGSSTEQAPGDKSDCVLKPAYTCPDPIRGGDNVLVMCEVMYNDMKPHETNTRNACEKAAKKFKGHESWFGLEQEYTLLHPNGWPYGFPQGSFPGPQGPYYCGVGADKIYGRPLVEKHLELCLKAGLAISGINGEVMPGQWEFQVGPVGAPGAGDELYIARWLLQRLGEDFGIVVSFDAKPMQGDWNGAGCHTNFSTAAMRRDGGYAVIEKACKALGHKVDLHVKGYGAGIEDRLTGKHETAPYNKFSYGVSNRGASVRIPWQVPIEGKGYLEDRRPNANMDPYTVTRLLIETVCAATPT